uniref:Uncharacterized protein n=1 Tax=Lotharella oceanica TaxID=641309 RepID=A0A7S2X6J4_9EUKA|eukprot:CAMPEP_0170182018 /NCGR_PEP_ID=MMETSP0040_2-20121228/26687_1 /TAXON_ID=641309 /ORGANISM="Lotharella oceanica, Strain CCMP622" /LENGTH=306 /DNA_ID=CAMNT_0010427273 /DNA_START=73 /DNA_END=993 /DNA_ORIENTATION=+
MTQYACKQIVALLCLVAASLWVASDHGGPAVQGVFRKFHCTVRLDQYWAMFDKGSFQSDGWPVAVARLGNGSAVELFQPFVTHRDSSDPWGETSSWAKEFGNLDGSEEAVDKHLRTKPDGLLASWYPMWRWRKYVHRTFSDRKLPHLRSLGRWLCNQWNILQVDLKSGKGSEATRVDLYWIAEGTKCDSATGACQEKNLDVRRLVRQECPVTEGMPLGEVSPCDTDAFSDFVKSEWDGYRRAAQPKAFAVTKGCAGCYYYYGSKSLKKAINDAINRCNKELGGCNLFAANDERYTGVPLKGLLTET